MADEDRLRSVPTTPFFPATEYEERLRRVRSAMEERQLDCMIVLRPSSVDYICGFHTVAEPAPRPAAVLFDRLVLCVGDAEVGRALMTSQVDEIHRFPPESDGVAAFVRRVVGLVGAGGRVGVELDDPWVPPRLPALLNEAGARVVDGQELIERVRLVLSPAEVDVMRRAAATTSLGIAAAGKASFEPNATDASVAAAIHQALTQVSDSAAAVNPIVATGAAAGVLHATWCGRPMDRRLPTIVEFAGAFHRYCAPVMRTIAPAELDQTGRRLEELASTTLASLLASLRPGLECSQVARTVLKSIEPFEDWVLFHYIFGYPVGIGHPPTWQDGATFHISVSNDGVLEPGMAFHLPASFRDLGRTGIAHSQTVLVVEGGVEVLTPSPAALITAKSN